MEKREPNDLAGIRQLRPPGPHRFWDRFDPVTYREKLEGALLGRFAGCTLGVPVEGWSPRQMEELARENKDPFPPTDYWKQVSRPSEMHYGRSAREVFTRGKMNGVPADDDLAYTLLGLFIIEEYGPNFTTEDVGKAWLKYLPVACTAEEVTLRNLKAGISAMEAGIVNNPFTDWIGAERFAGMAGAHTINNACLTIFGLAIGKRDFSRVIGETVAMGMDNDCTAATAGSIAGAVLSKAGIPPHWYQNFNDTIHTYLIGVTQLAITDIIGRFTTQAVRLRADYDKNWQRSFA